MGAGLHFPRTAAIVCGWALALLTAGPASAQEPRGGAAPPAEQPTDITLPVLFVVFAVVAVATVVMFRRRLRDGAPPLVDAEPPPAVTGPLVLGYIQAGAEEGGAGSAGLAAQESLIRTECAERGWRLAGVACDDHRILESGSGRPGLRAALDQLAEAGGCLVVAGLDRLGDSAVELGALVAELADERVALVSLDYGIDTTQQSGSQLAAVLAGVAALERDRVATETPGLAAVRAARRRRPVHPPSERVDVRIRISEMRAEGMTLQAIADTLNAEVVPTLRGGALWRPSSVQAATGYKRPRQPDGRRREEHGA